MISSELKETILHTARIEEVIGEFVKLRKRGTNLLGLCPFHNEKTPSFNVSAVRGLFKCFGCGKGGDVIEFLKEHEQLSFTEALKYLADKYNIEFAEEESTDQELKNRSERESILIVLKAAEGFYVKQLWESEEGQTIGLAYLKKRGLHTHTIEDFKLGWAPKEYSALTNWAKEAGYNMALLMKAGLMAENDAGERYDRFRERLVFPIHNHLGKTIAFGARTLKVDAKLAKYINSPETDLYNKSKVLYGLDKAKVAIKKQEQSILVEGYMDVISMHQSGIKNVVSASGTAFTTEQAQLLKRFADKAVFIFDGDGAGQKAAIKSIDTAITAELKPYYLQLPEGTDPDNFAQANDEEQIGKYLSEHLQNFIDYHVGTISEAVWKDPSAKAMALQPIVASIALVGDPVERSLFVDQLAGKAGVPSQALLANLASIYQSADSEKSREYGKPKTAEQDSSTGESKVEAEEIWPGLKTSDPYAIGRSEKEVLRLLVFFGERPVKEKQPQKVKEYLLEMLGGYSWTTAANELVFKALTSNDVVVLPKEAEEEGSHATAEVPESIKGDMEAMRVYTGIAMNMLNDPNSTSKNWKAKIGREPMVPGDHLEKELSSAVFHLNMKALRKMEDMIIEESKTIDQQDEAAVTANLQTMLNIQKRKKQLNEELGAVVLPKINGKR